MNGSYFIIRFFGVSGYEYIGKGTKQRNGALIKVTTPDRKDAQVFCSEGSVARKIYKLAKSKCVNIPKDVNLYSVEEFTDFSSSENRRIRGYNTLEG